MAEEDIRSAQQSLLRTKIMAPKLPRTLVSRRRLIDRLNSLRDKSLVLLVSAGGFGKTTLLSQWATHFRAGGGKVAWLSIDENDVDIWQLLRYLGLALNTADPLVGKEMLSLLMPGGPTIAVPLLLRSLVNDLACSTNEITLIIDDLHLSPCADLADAVEFLVVHAPDHFRVVLGTRRMPRIGLARLRAGGAVAELTEAELRFSGAESSEFLTRLGPDDLTAGQCSALHAGTEGWAAGLQLACISLQAGQSATDLAERMALPRGAVGLYLAEDILDHQPPRIVDFLLRTAVVERLCPALCNALTGETDGEAMLEQVRSRNLFLSPFEDEPSWFRYHGLMRKFLRNRLRADQPALFERLHRIACDWLAEQGLTAEAVRHALICRDQERAALLVESCGMPLVYQSETSHLLRLTEQLAPEVVAAHPKLQLAIAWALTLMRNPKDGILAVERLEAGLDACSEELRRYLTPRIGVVRATIAVFSDDHLSAGRLSAEWLDHADMTDEWERAVISNVLAFVAIAANDFARANLVYYDFKSSRRQIYSAVYGDVVNGIGLRLQGRLHEAANRFTAGFDNAVRHAGGFSAAATVSASCLAEINYEWNNFGEVRRLLQGRLDFIDDVGFIGCILSAYLPLIRLSGLERIADTVKLIERLELLGRTRLGGARIVAAALGERVRFHLMAGEAISAAGALREFDALAPAAAPAEGGAPLWIWEESQIAHARMDLFVGEAAAALGRLLPLIGQTEAAGRYGRSVVMRTLAVLALDLAGRDAEALAAFWELLGFAGPNGFARSLLDEGPAMRAFIARVMKTTPAPAVEQRRLTQLLPTLKRLAELAHQAELADADDPALYSLLTAREIDILSAVAAGQSNKEVARRLKVAPETVKWHMKNILTKLEAGNRTVAVRRAYELGLMTE